MAKKKLSIAFVYDDSMDGSEGVAHQVKTLGKWLSSQGHSVSYLAGESKSPEWAGGRVYSLSKNIKVRFNGNRLSIPLLAPRRRIIKALRAERPDILHVQVPHSPFMAQRVLNLNKTAAVIGTFHVYPSGKLAAIGAKYLKLMYFGGLNKFDCMLSVSPPAQKFASEAFGIRSAILPNAVDMSFLSSRAKKDPCLVVFLGRLVERKGAQELIVAFKNVIQKVPEARLAIGGSGPDKEKLERLTDQLGLKDSIQFHGFIPEEQKADFLGKAQIACFPSLYGESFGIVLIEAMAAGSEVVIGGDNPGYRSVLEENEQFLFNPADREALSAKLIELLTDGPQRLRLHAQQQEMVRRYDVNKIGLQLEDIYTGLIAQKNNKRHN